MFVKHHENENYIEIKTEDEEVNFKYENINKRINSMKNYYRILFLFKENNFIIQYYINEFNTISMNTLNTLFLSTPSRSISFDLKFNDSISLYGLPIRMSEMSLKPTDKDSGYRLFNLDCANHVPGDLQSLYGSIPIVHSFFTIIQVILGLIYPLMITITISR